MRKVPLKTIEYTETVIGQPATFDYVDMARIMLRDGGAQGIAADQIIARGDVEAKMLKAKEAGFVLLEEAEYGTLVSAVNSFRWARIPDPAMDFLLGIRKAETFDPNAKAADTETPVA